MNTPITDAAAFPAHQATRYHYGEDPLVDASVARRLETDRDALMKAVDILTLVIGFTPVKGNLEALQEAYDQARTALSTARANFPQL